MGSGLVVSLTRITHSLPGLGFWFFEYDDVGQKVSQMRDVFEEV